ncbi:MAG: hypothetical protein AAF081_18770 [Actinomycetota bacterium]
MASEPKLFKRRLLGYQRKAVDAHLATVDAAIAELGEQVASATSPDHHELVLRATRLSVEAVIEQAEADADRIRRAAHDEAAGILADAYALVRARDDVIDLTESATDDAGDLADDEAALFDGERSATDLDPAT